MPGINQREVDDLTRLLTSFIERRTGTFSVHNRSNPELVHYYSEIIRNWNKINFIFKRKLKITKKNLKIDNFSVAKYYIAIYLVIWEKQNILKVGKILNFSPTTNKLLQNLEFFSWNKALSSMHETEKLSLQLAVPSYMIDKLLPLMDVDSFRTNISYMDRQNEGTVFYFRLNNQIFDKAHNHEPDLILAELKEQGLNVQQDPHFKDIYLADIRNKKNLLVSNAFKENKLIIQDKASYAVAHLLEPQTNELIFDMCAAPGIKTSIIAQLSQRNSRILANDFSTRRINAMNHFLGDQNAENIHLINSDGISFPLRSYNFFDKILLDAPCTGSGTFSTNPELKWRQNEGFLHQNLTIQEKLLKSAIKLLKPSGTLVYSTCSLYSEEGELQILKILDQCIPMDLPKWFSPSYMINDKYIEGTGRLFPAIHKTKGFFIAKFKKK